MYHIRVVKTASMANAVQIVSYVNRHTVVAAHIGSAHNKDELLALKKSAKEWIKKVSGQRSLFPTKKQATSTLVSLEKCRYLGIRYSFVYEVITKIFSRFKFHTLSDNLLTDLALLRIIEPASLLSSIELLDELFGIKYLRKDFYQHLRGLADFRKNVEAGILALARRELGFDFTLVFYDITTLYFESFNADFLRKQGFSKDGKSTQPQILVGLIVNSEGFPVAYEIYEGNKFEGHTLIPSILNFRQKHKVETFTVVADAAMISADNIKALKDQKLSYIVGARVANLTESLINEISQKLNLKDEANIRIETKNGILICDFSEKRYRKNKYEMDKQITKAEMLLSNPTRAIRTKFVRSKSKNSFELNQALLKKTEKLLGIKGYYTNLDHIDNRTIINRYHDLWHVEQAFRLTKSDLDVRPIYHFKKEAIEAHILICFMALAVCKYMEIRTGKSINAIVKLLKSVTDARILNTLAREEIVMRSVLPKETEQLLEMLGLSH